MQFYNKTPFTKQEFDIIKKTDTILANRNSPIVNRVKHIDDKPRSPLALQNVGTENKGMLVKKRRNVPKTTVATQTDVSCFSLID